MPQIRFFVLAALLLKAFATPVAIADDAPAMTREQGDRILDELGQIRLLLQRIEQQGRALPAEAPPAPPPRREAPPLRVGIGVTDRPVLGAPDAPVALVEFVDYECPFCRRFFSATYARLKSEYIDSGKVKLVLKDMPLGFHRQARVAALATHCAGDQGAFWGMHEKLFAGTAGLNEGALRAYAQQLDLDLDKFAACMTAGPHLARIDADAAEAKAAGVTGTPAFIIGREGGGRVEGAHVRGALPFAVFKNHIDRLLAETSD